MRQLRFLKPGDDPDHVVLETADGGEQFGLRVDAAMRDAVRSDLPRVRPTEYSRAPAVSSAPVTSAPSWSAGSDASESAGIGPREIQVRVRAGESPQDLAEEHGMSLEKVMRFAGPVIAERSRVADEARRARARRSTTEGQTVVFGEAVDERFGAHGIDTGSVRWGAHRREDGQWVIGARWLGGDADRLAEWVFHLSTRTVTPIDDTAADLLSDRPIRAVVVADQRPELSTAPRLAPGIVAFPVMPNAHTGKLPVIDEVFDQEAIDEDQPRGAAGAPSVSSVSSASSAAPAPAAEPSPTARPASKRSSAAKRAAAQASAATDAPADTDYDAPPLPLRLSDPTAPAAETAVSVSAAQESDHQTTPLPRVAKLGTSSRGIESEDQRAERSRIPSWDDIMLGVRRKSD